jgi:sugar phosphate isomerase/epimerase
VGAAKSGIRVDRERLDQRLGLNVPHEWWPAGQLVKSFEAAGFGWTQVPSPPSSVLADPHLCATHAHALAAALDTTTIATVVHGPVDLVAGSPGSDRAFEGLLAYAADAGARQVVYHARNFPDSPESEDRALAETRSLARLAGRAERLGIVIALENLAPVFPGPEMLGHTPLLLRSLVRRISSPALGLCVDVGHAHVVADIRHASVADLIEPALDSATMLHLHDNLGARRLHAPDPALDPLRLDLHLPPGRGNLPWRTLAPLLHRYDVPMIFEVHPPHRAEPSQLRDQAAALLTAPPRGVVPA